MRTLLVARHERFGARGDGRSGFGFDPNATVGELHLEPLVWRNVGSQAHSVSGVVAHESEAATEDAVIAEGSQHLACGVETAAIAGGARGHGA